MVSLTPEAQFSSDGMRLTFSNNSMFSGSESNPESLIPEAVFKKNRKGFPEVLVLEMFESTS